jgi:ABC-type dipeptide/oligopeptide/nickel transport system permease subunit
MLQDAFGYPFQAWWYGVFPGVWIVWCALAYLLISQGIEHAIARGPQRAIQAPTVDVLLGVPEPGHQS